ncbi:MAG: bifunctional DNA-formamidopyrimidine glycosylase/DNA-(apurinic or apyrimidinic site) lyase [Patescibacteria group bacterium]
MPELPEVETIVRRLQEVVVGKKFSNIQKLHKKSFVGDINNLINTSITKVSRRAKFINFHLNNDLHLLTHLKMTGQMIYVGDDARIGGGHPTADWVQNLPAKHTRIAYDFHDGSKLYFNDQRIFGWMKVINKNELEQIFSKYGEDINKINKKNILNIIKKINKSRRAIKQVLLDQKILAGLGNIYVCEALWLAKIDPQIPANLLSESQISELLDFAIKIINKAIDLGGTTFDGKYVGVDGFSGNFQNELKVYGQEGETCSRCGSLIQKTKQGGRGTYYCSGCQR